MHRTNAQQRRDIKSRNSPRCNEQNTKEIERKSIISCACNTCAFHCNDINENIIELLAIASNILSVELDLTTIESYFPI